MKEFEATLKDVNTDDVEPMVHVMEMTNILREDERIQNFSRSDLLKSAPQCSDDSWQVPRLVK